MKSVATRNEIATQFVRFPAAVKSNARFCRRTRICKIVDAHVFHFVEDLPTGFASRSIEILDHLVLSVDRDSLPAGQFREINPVRPPPESQVHSVMDEPLFLQPLANSRLNHQVNSSLLQHARSHPFFHILLAAILNNDRFDSLQMQKMRKHQPGRTGADNPHLRAQFLHNVILIPRALPRAAKIHFLVSASA